MARDHLRAGHEAHALEAFWTATQAPAVPAVRPNAVQSNAPAAVLREIGGIFAATLGFVLAVDLALIAFGVR